MVHRPLLVAFLRVAFLASEADAAAAMRPDDTDPTASGCGGMFPWTLLTP